MSSPNCHSILNTFLPKSITGTSQFDWVSLQSEQKSPYRKIVLQANILSCLSCAAFQINQACLSRTYASSNTLNLPKKRRGRLARK